MMKTKPAVTVARIDHGVLPANDLGRSFLGGFHGRAPRILDQSQRARP